MTTKKLDKEHLESINKIRNEFAENVTALGNIELEILATQERLDALASEKSKRYATFLTLRQQEQELVTKMRERYGEGQINIEAGTFTEQESV